MKTYLAPKFLIQRDPSAASSARCVLTSALLATHFYDLEDDEVRSRAENCIDCHRCVLFFPTHALTSRRYPLDYRENYNWCPKVIEDIIKQAETWGH